jgi:hypothetical protein
LGQDAPDVAPTIASKRRTIDSFLVGYDVAATALFTIGGALFTWGHSSSNHDATKELSSQHHLPDSGPTDH